MRTRQRAFLLVTVLLISLILFTMGFAFLGSRGGMYQSTYQSTLACQARALARSGLEDAKIKMIKDENFPPVGGLQQYSYAYAEDVNDGPGGAYLGCYRVVVDTTYAQPPFSVIRVTSTGLAGPKTNSTARHTYNAYLDITPYNDPPATPPATPSPTYFQWVRFDDLGGL